MATPIAASQCVQAVRSKGYKAQRLTKSDGRATVLVYAPQTEEVNGWLNTLDTLKPYWDSVERCWRIEFPRRWAK